MLAQTERPPHTRYCHQRTAVAQTERSIDQFMRRTTLRQIEIGSMVRWTGSVTAAAMALKTSAANVSRMCRRFEENSPSPVFRKTRKGVAFTEWGMSLMQEIKVLEDALVEFSENSDTQYNHSPRGTSAALSDWPMGRRLRSFGATWLRGINGSLTNFQRPMFWSARVASACRSR